jgi:hypothetical protein
MSWAQHIESEQTTCFMCGRGVHQVLQVIPTQRGLVCDMCVTAMVEVMMRMLCKPPLRCDYRRAA